MELFCHQVGHSRLGRGRGCRLSSHFVSCAASHQALYFHPVGWPVLQSITAHTADGGMENGSNGPCTRTTGRVWSRCVCVLACQCGMVWASAGKECHLCPLCGKVPAHVNLCNCSS
jgi:hypothetical protein